jgi:hypothetical protein
MSSLADDVIKMATENRNDSLVTYEQFFSYRGYITFSKCHCELCIGKQDDVTNTSLMETLGKTTSDISQYNRSMDNYSNAVFFECHRRFR